MDGPDRSALAHVFWDQEIFFSGGEWGCQGTSVFDWEDFLKPPYSKFANPWEQLQNNSYSEDELKHVKEAYANIMKNGSILFVTLLDKPKPEFAGLYEFENAIMDGLWKKIQQEKPAVTAEDLKAFGGEKKEEPEKGYDVSAADLKRAFGGTSVVPIDEMDRRSVDVTMADLKKAFAQIDTQKGDMSQNGEQKATTIVTKEVQLGVPRGIVDCKVEHESERYGYLHIIYIANRYSDGRSITASLYPPDRNELLYAVDVPAGKENGYMPLPDPADKGCSNYRVVIDSGIYIIKKQTLI